MNCKFPQNECLDRHFNKELGQFICDKEGYCMYGKGMVYNEKPIKESSYEYNKCKGQTVLK
jgi:hypothetical protein